MMNYDKKNGDVCFRESDHVYFNERKKDITYTSVTTLIGKYHEKFDPEFWSRYKALEKCLSKEDFTMIKSKMLRNRKADIEWFDKFSIDPDVFNNHVDEILESYRLANEAGCKRGTEYHLKKELAFYENKIQDVSSLVSGCNGSFECEKHNWDLSREKAVIPEFLIYYHCPDGILNIAGQIDLLIKDGNDIYLIDWKTNSKGIKEKAFFDPVTKKLKTMFYPLNNLNDTMLIHYTLQLSLYAWMMQKINPSYNIKLLRLHHIDGNDVETDYDLIYLKDDVERLLKYHKKTMMNGKNK